MFNQMASVLVLFSRFWLSVIPFNARSEWRNPLLHHLQIAQNTSNSCTLNVQEAFLESNQYSSSLQHKCRHTDFTSDEFTSITFSPPPARPHLPVSSFLTSTPWKASSAVTDEFVNSTPLIHWWVSGGGHFPFVVFLREKQLNGTFTLSIMVQRQGVQSNKANKENESNFSRVAERLIKIEMTKTAFLSPKIRTDGKKMCFI